MRELDAETGTGRRDAPCGGERAVRRRLVVIGIEPEAARA